MPAKKLIERIEREGAVTFRDFMDAALYDPEEGYYAKGPHIGADGDFYTANNVSLFPHALSRFVKAALERMGGARVVELGAGTGELADKLGADVTIVEPSAGLAAKQQARGLQVVRALEDLRSAPTLFVANEVLDALPVHRVTSATEKYVALQNGKLVEIDGPLTIEPRDVPEGTILEVNQNADQLLASMANAAPKSLALFIDYAAAEPRPGGTARGYKSHVVTDALANPGDQDITADVDFAAIAKRADKLGYRVAGLTTQGEFLADLGLIDDMTAALSRGDMNAYLAAKGLIMPGGMGERFKVLLLARDVATQPALPGFRKDTYAGASRR